MILTELYLQNFILIHQSRIPFHTGLNIITGETGAGKSILLEAIMILLGKRLSPDHKNDSDKPCVIEGTFQLNLKNTKDKTALAHLETLGIDSEESFVIRRVLDKNNRQKSLIHEQNISTQALQQVFAPLIEICGQHEFHGLLRADRHLTMLDEGLAPPDRAVLEGYQKSYGQCLQQRQNLEALETQERAWQAKSDFLNFQKEFFENKRPTSPKEDMELEARIHGLQQTQDARNSLGEALVLLDDPDQGLLTLLQKLSRTLDSLGKFHPKLQTLSSVSQELLEKAGNLSSHLQDQFSKVNVDSTENLDALNERLFFLQTLKNKYGPTLEEVCRYIQSVETQIGEAGRFSQRKSELLEQIKALEKDCLSVAQKLHTLRQTRAQSLQSQINEISKSLGMVAPQFEVRFHALEPQPASRGLQDAEFYMSFNQGKAPGPVCKIASGGELSRLMLAFRAASCLTSEVGIYLFDEVDAGVGGQTARKIGAYLYQVAHRHPSTKTNTQLQVICITHLPQIAVYADHHILVQKQSEHRNTTVEIQALHQNQDRIQELVRMMGGDATHKHALETVKHMQTEVRKQKSLPMVS